MIKFVINGVDVKFVDVHVYDSGCQAYLESQNVRVHSKI